MSHTANALNEPAVPPDTYRPGGWNGRYIMILVIMVLIPELGILVSLYPVNALGLIAAEYRTDQVAWIPAIVSLAAVLSPVVGKLADRYGKKRALVSIILLAVTGLLISAFAPNYPLLLLGRLLQAPTMSFGFLLPSLVRDIFPTRTIAVAASVALTGAGAFTIVAQLFVAPILESFGWRGTFWVPAALGVVVLLLVLLVIPESSVRDRSGRIDLVGATLIGFGIGGVLLGISFGGSWGWTSPGVLTSFTVGIVVLVLWVLHARRAKDPIVDIREISHAPVIMSMLLGSIGSALTSWFYAILAIIALQPAGDWGLGVDPTQQGYMAALWSLGGGIGGFLGGFALTRFPGPRVLGAEMIVLTSMFVVVFTGLRSPVLISIASFLIGMVGAGLASGSMYMIIRLVAPQRQAVVSSITMLMIGVITGIVPVVLFAVMNALGDRDAVSGVVAYTFGSMSAATLVPVGLGALGILCAIVLARRIPAAAAIPSAQIAKQKDAETAAGS